MSEAEETNGRGEDRHGDTLGYCEYRKVPFGAPDRVTCSKADCYRNYGGNGYQVLRWTPLPSN